MEAWTEEGELLGIITDVMQTGANDVYVVQVSEESPYALKVGNKRKELLLPAIKECVRNVDMEARKIKVHLMPGLLGEG